MWLRFTASASLLMLLTLGQQQSRFERTYAYPDGIDALSVHFAAKSDTAGVRWKTTSGWSDWEDFAVEDEQDPDLLESNLVMFPQGVTEIALRGETVNDLTLHPIRVSQEGVRYQVAATTNVGTPRILAREQWGADPELLISKAATTSSTSSSSTPDKTDTPAPDNSGESVREQDCNEAYRLYPEEFKASVPITTNADGKRLRWPLQYSPNIRLLVVHHTAATVSTDKRSGPERMRALYQFHANSRGWGDVGYNYIIDERGQIYEGRQGGDSVVAGHAYCNNVNTMGIALMGNFDAEQPTQPQTQSLQWLLNTLGDKYHMDLGRQVLFHGKTLPPVVGHRQLVSTSCPGAVLFTALDQVRAHARSGDTGAPVTFIAPPSQTAASSSSKPRTSGSQTSALRAAAGVSGLSALGSTALEARPGGEVLLSLFYAPKAPIKRGNKIAAAKLSNPRLKLFQEKEGTYVPIRGAILASETLPATTPTVVRLKVTMPPDKGTYTLIVGDITYTITSTGKRIGKTITPTKQSYFPDSVPRPVATVTRSASSVRPTPAPVTVAAVPADTSGSAPMVRIRLGDDSLARGTVMLQTSARPKANGSLMPSNSVGLRMEGTQCIVSGINGDMTSGDSVRIDPGTGFSTITSFTTNRQRFRGILECRVVDGSLALINELPLEDYLAGLGEEPDTELYEKQRAFAVAARTYAAYYMNPAHRKFPGKPYDGSDSPAEFQLYGGMDMELKNPRWVKAVKSTANLVLKVGTDVLRTPYFSSDDGRTRSTLEAGWKDFPHAEVFGAKDDHWCNGLTLRGHGVGMSGCGAKGQAAEGKTGEQILQYYYPGTSLTAL